MNTIQEIAADIARELREDPTRWTKGSNARDRDGLKISHSADAACSWCLVGHLIKRHAFDARHYFKSPISVFNLPDWNDAPERTVEDVIALCDKVAAS